MVPFLLESAWAAGWFWSAGWFAGFLLSVAALVGGVDLLELGFQGLELALEAAELGLE